MVETQENYDRRTLKSEFYQQSQSPPVVIEGESHPVPQGSDATSFDTIDSILRLVVGGTFELTDGLISLLRQWEEDAVTDPEKMSVPVDETVSVLMRYVFVGLIFDTERRMRRGVSSAGSMLTTIAGAAATVARPITNSRLMAPARRRAATLSDQVVDELVRLIQIGRQEENLGRRASNDVADDIMDQILAYMAENPAIAELVRQQGRGMTAQLLGVVRERTATGDNSVEGLVRKFLHKTPRTELSGPPDIVKMQTAGNDETGKIETSGPR